MQTDRQTPNDERLKELMLHIAEQCEGDPTFGATKLNKILFYSDFWHYAEAGDSITGQPYRRLQGGPCPVRLIQARNSLTEAGDAAIQKSRVMNLVRNKLVALREANEGLFTGRQMAIVNKVIKMLWGKSAEEVSELSHKFVGWKVAEDNEEIPYQAVFVSNRPLTEAEATRGREIEAELFA